MACSGRFEHYVAEFILGAARKLDEDERRDTYVICLWTWRHPDGWLPITQVGHNTVSRAQSKGGNEEAFWNFALWLQDDLGLIAGGGDPEGARLLEQALRDDECWVDANPDDLSDEEVEDLELDDLEDETRSIYFSYLSAAISSLHDRGALQEIFGKPIPVIAVDMEFPDHAEWASANSNPQELVAAFGAYRQR